MAVFVVGSYNVTEPRAYQSYVEGVQSILKKHGGQILSVDQEAEALEGENRDMVLILKFDSKEDAKAWYEDEAYQPLKNLRQSCTEHSSMFITQEMPR